MAFFRYFSGIVVVCVLNSVFEGGFDVSAEYNFAVLFGKRKRTANSPLGK